MSDERLLGSGVSLSLFFFQGKEVKKKKKKGQVTWLMGRVRGSRRGDARVLQGGFQSSALPPG